MYHELEAKLKQGPQVQYSSTIFQGTNFLLWLYRVAHSLSWPPFRLYTFLQHHISVSML